MKPLLVLTSIALLALAGCSSDSDADDAPPPPAPETLFDTLAAASPNKLRGVWSTVSKQPGGTVEARFRFTEKYVVGAAKCTFTSGDIEPIVAGGSIGLDTAGLDAQSGTLTMGALVVEKTTDKAKCTAGIPQGGSFDFAIDGTKLTLTKQGFAGGISLDKIGD